MNSGDKVNTPLGKGEVVRREAPLGVLGGRFVVKMDKFPKSTYYSTLHTEQGGLFFFESNLSIPEGPKEQLDLF